MPLRTVPRRLAASLLAAALLVPALPAAAAPSFSGGWWAELFATLAGWLTPASSSAAVSDQASEETLPNIDPDGLTASEDPGTQPHGRRAHGETLLDIDPNGIAAGPGVSQSQPGH